MLRPAAVVLLLAVLAGCVPVEIVPNGKGVLAYRTETGVVLTSAKGEVLKRFPDLIGEDEGEIWLLAWSPDDRHLAFTARRDLEGEDQQILSVLDTETGKVRELFAREVDVLYPPRWSPDGSALSVVVADSKKTELRVLDLESGKDRLLARQCAAFHAWAPGGGRIAVALTGQANLEDDVLAAGSMALIDVATGEADPLVRLVFSESIVPVFPGDGRLLFNAPRVSLPTVLESPKSLPDGLYAFDLGKKTLTALHGEGENIGYVAASPSGERILYVLSEADDFLEGEVVVTGKGIEGRVRVGRNHSEDFFPGFLDEERVVLLGEAERGEGKKARILLHRIGEKGLEDVSGLFPGVYFPEK